MRITLGVINLLLALIFGCIVLSLGFGVEIVSKETLASIFDVKGFSKDILRALFWFETAGRYGNIDGLRSAGYIYEYGLGVNKNLEKAIYFYEKEE